MPACTMKSVRLCHVCCAVMSHAGLYHEVCTMKSVAVTNPQSWRPKREVTLIHRQDYSIVLEAKEEATLSGWQD